MAGISTVEPTSSRRRLLPRSLFARSLLIIALPMILLQIIVAVIFFNRVWDSTSNRVASALAGEIAYVNDQMAHASSQQERQHIAETASHNLGLTVELVQKKNALSMQEGRDPFAHYSWFSPGATLQAELKSRLDVPFVLKPYEKEKWFVVEVEYAPGKLFMVLSHERRVLSSTTYIFFLWLIGGAFVLASISVLFMRNQIRPILRLAVAAEKLGKGQDVPDFKPVGATEVRAAAHAFLDMKDRLRRQIEQRTFMLAGVSHDLRTPLTRMKLQLALMPQGTERTYLEQDVAEMEMMIDGYLTFAKGAGEEATDITDLALILRRIVDNAGREGHQVEISAPEPVYLRIRPQAMERAIANLVSNASRFGNTVSVSLHRDEGSGIVTLIVDDNGPGIAPKEREHVFKPFYRVEKSRNKKTGGMGLGLSIAQDVILGHGGDIVLEDSPMGGLRVRVVLPA